MAEQDEAQVGEQLPLETNTQTGGGKVADEHRRRLKWCRACGQVKRGGLELALPFRSYRV